MSSTPSEPSLSKTDQSQLAPTGDSATAAITAVEGRNSVLARLLDAFREPGAEGLRGAQKRLAEAAGRDQSAVSRWASRGVPMEAAVDIERGAAALGVDIKAETILAWIADEARTRPANVKPDGACKDGPETNGVGI